MSTLERTTRSRALSAIGAWCLPALFACTGVVSHDGRSGPVGASDDPPGSGSDAGPVKPADGQTQEVDPGSKGLHRLNSAEYNNSVHDVLGSSLALANGNWANEENLGFDNIASVMRVDEKQYSKYFEAAGQIADDVFQNPDLKARIVTCDAEDDVECVTGIVGSVGLRIFRRPLSDDEIGTYSSVYFAARELGEDHDGSLEHVLRALLSSAEFLYRIETDPDPESMQAHRLDPYQLASRLSYFLWSSAPDEALLDAAKENALESSEGLRNETLRLLADEKSERWVRNFSGQWLGARKVAAHGVNSAVYPEWTPTLAAAMAEEVYEYFGEFLRSERSFMEFLTADVNFVDEELAALYGMEPPPNDAWARVEDADDARKGFFGLGAFLSMSSYEYRTAPTLRGRWILINLLCTPPQDPPGGIPPLDSDPGSSDASEGNVRERLEKHREDPTCARCHAALDPYGIALENFDGIGKYRDEYRSGDPVDASTVTITGESFTGLDGLAEVVAQKPQFTTCIASKVFTYGLGRDIGAIDEPVLKAIHDRWTAETPTLTALLDATVQSDSFRFRRPLAQQGAQE
jgi:hypothetical protein